MRKTREELVAELAATRLQLAASERSRKAAQKAAQEKDEECAGAKADALRLDDEVKRLESELAKVGVAEKIREREALRALQEREWERGEANADHARVLRDATTRAEDAERECQSLRKRSEDAEARADAAENRTRDVTTRIEHLERSAKDSARASKGSSLTAEINCALRQELEELGLELATAREETEARLAEVKTSSRNAQSSKRGGGQDGSRAVPRGSSSGRRRGCARRLCANGRLFKDGADANGAQNRRARTRRGSRVRRAIQPREGHRGARARTRRGQNGQRNARRGDVDAQGGARGGDDREVGARRGWRFRREPRGWRRLC